MFRRDIFDYMRDGEELVDEPFQRLLAQDQLLVVPARRILAGDGHLQGSPET